jgi:hypothetical protein
MAMHVNDYIVESFLKVITNRIISDPDYDMAEYRAPGIYNPYSIEEWNDVMAHAYSEFVCDDSKPEHAKDEPIVYLTRPSKRNVKLGEYQRYLYTANEPPTVPNPDVAVVQNPPRQGRSMPEKFWSYLCRVRKNCPTSAGGRTMVPLFISIRVVLVGSVLWKTYGEDELLKGVNSITKAWATTLHQKQISPHHRMSDMFPDFHSFQQFCTNTNKTIWFFGSHPHHPGVSDAQKAERLAIHVLCEQFQLDIDGDGISPQIDGDIARLLARRRLIPILEMGLKGMNADYLDYILALQVEFNERVRVAMATQAGTYSTIAISEAEVFRR